MNKPARLTVRPFTKRFPSLTMNRYCLTLLALMLAAVPAAGQVTERPLAFDSVGRVPAVTPSLAERLHLGPPLWPVLGRFVSAQLFSKSTGGYTLVVTRPDGAFDRYDLTAEAGVELRGVVETALASGQRAGVGEQTSVASDPAGNAFVRNQALLGAFLYGPAAATFVGGASHNASGAIAAELLTVGGTFAAALARRNALPAVTTAQNHLSFHAALHGAALGEALVYISGGESATAHGAALLAGSVGGTMLGLRAARTMTDAEAASSAYAADFSALGALGILGSAGAFDNSSAGRPSVAIASAALVAGYALGPYFPRRAPYTVTAGDVDAMTVATVIGIFAAATPFIGDHNSDGRVVAASLTAGMVVGAIAGDRWLVRPRDHTRSEATLLLTGASVGAAVGGGVGALGSASAQPTWALAVAGALLGTVATEAAVHPRPGGRRVLSSRTRATRNVALEPDEVAPAHEINPRRTQITFDPIGAVFAVTSRVGTFSVVRVSF